MASPSRRSSRSAPQSSTAGNERGSPSASDELVDLLQQLVVREVA